MILFPIAPTSFRWHACSAHTGTDGLQMRMLFSGGF